MVIRFENRPGKDMPRSIDRRLSQRVPVPARRLTDREVEHRRRMLNHLRTVSSLAPEAPSGQNHAADARNQ